LLPATKTYEYVPVLAMTGASPVSTAPIGPVVVTTTAEPALDGAGVTVPETWIVAWPVYVCALVVTVTVSPAANAANGPRTKKAASRTVAMVLSVFISITW
jgi:hypothetical protein